jgi:hypothetical protein
MQLPRILHPFQIECKIKEILTTINLSVSLLLPLKIQSPLESPVLVDTHWAPLNYGVFTAQIVPDIWHVAYTCQAVCDTATIERTAWCSGARLGIEFVGHAALIDAINTLEKHQN